MSKSKSANHVQVKLAVTPPPSKTWRTPSYHLDHYTIRQNVRVVTVQLHGVRGHEKRTETISFPLLQGVSETDLVRAAVFFSPNKWTVSFGMNVSQFHGKFSQQVDEQLLHALMNQSRSTNKRQPAQKHASPGATTASLSPQSQPCEL